ncbi:hypothetical protein OKW96_05850 [Sphingobacterium sp. KU25419]|nr:hypothetical protein OKW96_05850 [Sphingobacterium sp. KU25419]
MNQAHLLKNNSSASGDKSINILDLVKYLLHHWKWFVLSVLIFGGYYYYQYEKSTLMYSTMETVMIKTASNTPTSTTITRSSIKSVNVASEILQLKSKELMRNTVERLDANISYSIKRGLRMEELYKDSPVLVKFTDSSFRFTSNFKLIPLSEQKAQIIGLDKAGTEVKVEIPLNQEVKTAFGQFKTILNPETFKSYIGKEIISNEFQEAAWQVTSLKS